ncbi:effector-associated domain 2-containing protein [Streptomyces sp. NRRL WC-3549]|uniref:VMAP-C domain-containing protein n=1 Tax=Streptomyces sp. NRRL WC-3549 TaxID=1463925 RepID=UPI000A9C01AF|nr:hypothetical protein [Streptomyces sp. NRRL WC-3549]
MTHVAQGPGESGAYLVVKLVNELCALPCVRDPDQCSLFVGFVGMVLETELTYMRRSPRAEMVALVMDVMKRTRGLDALVQAVGALAGPEDSARLARLTGDWPGEAVAGLEPEFDDGAVQEARRMLAEIPARDDSELYALLCHELGLVDLPHGQSPSQRFDFLCEVSAQADGLPPALVFLEVLAPGRPPGLREKLREWSDRWARDAGPEAVAALETRRQAIAALPRADPEVPRCLVVMAEPADDGSADVYVRHWVNAASGYWEPVAGDVERATRDTLAEAIERAVGRGEARWAEVAEADDEPPVQVEFVLPYQYLNDDMARIGVGTRTRDPVPLGLRYRIHLRSLDRMRARDPRQLRRWHARWRRLRQTGVAETFRWYGEPDGHLGHWHATLASEPRLTAVILDVPALPGHGLEALMAAIDEGVGLAAWDRRPESPDLSGEVLTLLLGHPPSQLPGKVSQLRKEAEGRDRGGLFVGRHLAFFWDDPNRLVDCEELTA